MKYLLIQNDRVENIVIADPTIVDTLFSDYLVNEYQDGVGIGWVKTESGFNPPVQPDPEPQPNPPNWPGFNLAISLDTNMVIYEAVANQVHPSIVGKKDLAYSIIADKGLDNFAAIFPLFCQMAQVTVEHREAWAQMAEGFDLPSDFVAVVRG